MVIQMITMNKIIREGNQLLRNKSTDVEIPVQDEDKKTLIDMLSYVINSQDEEKAEKLNLRPGVGLAAPQIGINKKMFAIATTDLNGKPWILPVVNPKITNTSKEMIYLPGGEGCLSVDRSTTGVTPRYRKIEATAYIYNFNKDRFEKTKLVLDDYIAIVFQHEYDHLFGTLFVDTIIDELEAKKRGCKPLWENES